jgi:hypothetical protein
MSALKVNADYETELFGYSKAPLIVNQSLEFLAFFLSDRPVYTSKKYTPDYLDYVERITGHRPETISTGEFENYWGPLKNLELEKWWNSKITTTELVIKKGWCHHTFIIRNSSEIKDINWARDYLLKDPFGMSGQRFKILYEHMDLPEKRIHIENALKNGPIIIEPFFKRKFDFSQYVFPDGKIISYENIVDKNFQYKGSLFSDLTHPELTSLNFYKLIHENEWESYQTQTLEIVNFFSKYKNEIGYSIDSFIYEEDGQFKIRALSEVNYRRTMGRVAYELSLRYGHGKSWTMLKLIKSNPKINFRKTLHRFLENKSVVLFSPGDTRFEILLLLADDKFEGEKLMIHLNELLSDGQSTI